MFAHGHASAEQIYLYLTVAERKGLPYLGIAESLHVAQLEDGPLHLGQHLQTFFYGFAKVEALGEEMIPYLIGYTFKIIDTDPENQKKAMLMLLCSIAKYGTGREVDRTILPEYPEEFRKYWIEGNCRSWSVRFYLWYTGKQAG